MTARRLGSQTQLPHSQLTELLASPRGQTYHRQTRLIQLDKTPKLASTPPAKSGRQPSDSESAAQLHPGPQPPSGRAKVATRYYHVMTTQLGTRPNLPLLYGPSSGGLPADSESTAQLHPGPAPAIGPGQGDDTVLPNDNDSARHSPKLAAPQRTKFRGQPADSESSARLYRHVRGVTTDTRHERQTDSNSSLHAPPTFRPAAPQRTRSQQDRRR